MSTQTIKHIVLFKVKDDTNASKANAMVNGLSSLISPNQVLHLSVGPVLRNQSSAFNFIHMLHSRNKLKNDLSAYAAHPTHISVVKGLMPPIYNDIIVVDWVAKELQGDVILLLGSGDVSEFSKVEGKFRGWSKK